MMNLILDMLNLKLLWDNQVEILYQNLNWMEFKGKYELHKYISIEFIIKAMSTNGIILREEVENPITVSQLHVFCDSLHNDSLPGESPDSGHPSFFPLH